MNRIADLSKYPMNHFFDEHPEYIHHKRNMVFQYNNAKEYEQKKLSKGAGIYETYDGDRVFWDGVTSVKGSIEIRKKKYITLSRIVIYLTEAGHKAIKEFVITCFAESS